jgi:hypothetical protein
MSREPDTGDMLLFRGNQVFSKLLECFGRSKYSHVGMILRNPRFLRPDLEDGLYLLESSSNDIPEAEEHSYHLGVQIHRLEDVLSSYPEGSVFIRHVSCVRNEAFYDTLRAIHKDIHHKPYDLNPADWIRAEWNLIHPLMVHSAYQKTDAFWCSALLCYVYGRLDLLEAEMDWSLIAPREFSAEEGTLLRFRCSVSPEVPFVLAPPAPVPAPAPVPLIPSAPLIKKDLTWEDHSQ